MAEWGLEALGGWRPTSPTQHRPGLSGQSSTLRPSGATGTFSCILGAGWACAHPGAQPGALILTQTGVPRLREVKCKRGNRDCRTRRQEASPLPYPVLAKLVQ